MLANRSIGIRTLGLFWQLTLVTLTYWGWLFIWQSAFVDPGIEMPKYVLYCEFLLIGILFGFDGRREINGLEKEWLVSNQKTLRQTFFGLFSVFLVLFTLKENTISRSFLISYVPWLYCSLLFTNYWLPRSLREWMFSGTRRERTALVGDLERVDRLQSWLERKRLMGIDTIGLVCSEVPADGESPLPILGTLDDIGDIVRSKAITQLIVLNLSLGSKRVREITQVCEDHAVRLLALHDLDAYFNHDTVVFEDEGIRFIALREEPLESPLNRFIKRSLDLAIAIPVILLILPICALIVWLIQILRSPGPIFFKQVRSGMMGRPFLIYKFRTMHVYNPSEAQQATKNDPRVFPGGDWLRKLSIDEIPQFINVLLGDMSVVGPRPHLPDHDQAFMRVMRNYTIRRFIRPGITGWAQVNGLRGEIRTPRDIQRRVEADIHYLESWSFGLDGIIILKTIKQCAIPPKMAY